MILTFTPAQNDWLEVTWTDDDKEVKHTSYHPTQIDLLKADVAALGMELAPQHETLLANWVADYVPPAPPVLTPEQIREEAKWERQIAVNNIKVTTAAGNTFDGDETSQTRMSRAILVLSTGYAPTVPWVLADNTVIQADVAELTEALARAGQAQAALWVI